MLSVTPAGAAYGLNVAPELYRELPPRDGDSRCTAEGSTGPSGLAFRLEAISPLSPPALRQLASRGAPITDDDLELAPANMVPILYLEQAPQCLPRAAVGLRGCERYVD